MWAPFLEKVWAKVSGNYAAIDGNIYGDPWEALNFFLGVPIDFYMVQTQSYDALASSGYVKRTSAHKEAVKDLGSLVPEEEKLT